MNFKGTIRFMYISLADNYCLKIRYKKLCILLGQINYKTLKEQADIVVCPGLELDHNLEEKLKKTFIINAPGEYEISGVSVYGTKEFFIIELGELRLCFFTKIDSVLKESQLEEMGSVDVLYLILGKDYIDKDKAARLVNQIQPSIILPVDQEEIGHFLQKIGYEEPRYEKKIRIIKSELPEETEVILLKSKDDQTKDSSPQS